MNAQDLRRFFNAVAMTVIPNLASLRLCGRSSDFSSCVLSAAEGAYQDVATLVPLEEGRKPYVSMEAMRILQRLLAQGNPKIGSLKVENLIDSTIIKKIEDSGFFEKMNSEYGGK